jgi:hypothetical protein
MKRIRAFLVLPLCTALALALGSCAMARSGASPKVRRNGNSIHTASAPALAIRSYAL